MITMKKVLAFLFATVLGFSLVGCDDQSGSSAPESSEIHQHTFAPDESPAYNYPSVFAPTHFSHHQDTQKEFHM